MTEIDADRPSYTNDRAQVTEEMVNVYIETMWPDLWSSRRAIGDLRAQVRIGLTAALAAAPKPDRPSASTIETMAKEGVQAREYLSGLLTHFAPQCKPLADLYGLCTQIDNLLVGMAAPKANDGVCSPLPAEVSEADIDTMHMWYNHPDSGATHDARLRSAIAAVFRAHATPPKPDQPEWAPPSSARPKNGSATMTEALKAIMALRNEWGGGTLGDAAQAIHTVLSTLVAEREAQARRDERVRAAAHGVRMAAECMTGWHEWPRMTNALSALAAALVENGR